ncbi:hypothetical protein BDP27DRAFT_1451545 [Rhodocollybia butyracea]|uniref:Uncharacterized protein n=1 Tax=Rhodocollybia butyracea TaxID=206335 RepID=A0A9P5PGS2_9AGAR|nr:hypothetical protein BDP27DRAFT_1451545 [Rhodocollybia butyracea]
MSITWARIPLCAHLRCARIAYPPLQALSPPTASAQVDLMTRKLQTQEFDVTILNEKFEPVLEGVLQGTRRRITPVITKQFDLPAGRHDNIHYNAEIIDGREEDSCTKPMVPFALQERGGTLCQHYPCFGWTEKTSSGIFASIYSARADSNDHQIVTWVRHDTLIPLEGFELHKEIEDLNTKFETIPRTSWLQQWDKVIKVKVEEWQKRKNEEERKKSAEQKNLDEPESQGKRSRGRPRKHPEGSTSKVNGQKTGGPPASPPSAEEPTTKKIRTKPPSTNRPILPKPGQNTGESSGAPPTQLARRPKQTRPKGHNLGVNNQRAGGPSAPPSSENQKELAERPKPQTRPNAGGPFAPPSSPKQNAIPGSPKPLADPVTPKNNHQPSRQSSVSPGSPLSAKQNGGKQANIGCAEPTIEVTTTGIPGSAIYLGSSPVNPNPKEDAHVEEAITPLPLLQKR